jgi:hypothetical protein
MLPHLHGDSLNACDPLAILFEMSKIAANEDVWIFLWI